MSLDWRTIFKIRIQVERLVSKIYSEVNLTQTTNVFIDYLKELANLIKLAPELFFIITLNFKTDKYLLDKIINFELETLNIPTNLAIYIPVNHSIYLTNMNIIDYTILGQYYISSPLRGLAKFVKYEDLIPYVPNIDLIYNSSKQANSHFVIFTTPI